MRLLDEVVGAITIGAMELENAFMGTGSSYATSGSKFISDSTESYYPKEVEDRLKVIFNSDSRNNISDYSDMSSRAFRGWTISAHVCAYLSGKEGLHDDRWNKEYKKAANIICQEFGVPDMYKDVSVGNFKMKDYGISNPSRPIILASTVAEAMRRFPCESFIKSMKEEEGRKRILNQKEEEKKKVSIEMESDLTAKELAYLTGLSEEKCKHYMEVNNMSGDEALESIDIFMQSLNDKVAVPIEIAGCMNNAGIYSEMANRLGAYNTMRGGVKGYGGFVFEEMHAADAAVKGVNINVLGNNGIADFIVKDSSGHEILVQAKAGYKAHQVDWNRYKGQTIVVDKGNVVLANEARAAGLKVQESAVFKKQADVVARTQQWESKITGKTSAPITGTAVGAHNAGLASAKLAAKVGVSMKLGENIYDIIAGNKDFGEAAADMLVDGAVLVGGAYLGTAALTAAGTIATTTATAFAGTAAGAAVTGAATSVATAVGSTAVGGAVITGASTVASAAASTAAAVTAAPLLPIIAGGVALGFVGKLISDNL